MNFKKPKNEVLYEAQMMAESIIRSTLYNVSPHGRPIEGEVVNALTRAMSMGIAEGLRVMMENIYTDAEFEEDLTLREKS